MVLTLVHVNPCSTEDDKLHTQTDKDTVYLTFKPSALSKNTLRGLTCSDFPALRLQFPRRPRRRTTRPEENKNTECDDVRSRSRDQDQRCALQGCFLLTCCRFHFFLLSLVMTVVLLERPSSRAGGISVASSSGTFWMIVSLLLFTDMIWVRMWKSEVNESHCPLFM